MNDKATSVRCMLLQLTTLNLLIPTSAVAEIIGYSTPRPLENTSDWFAGVVLWRGVYVPVVTVEEMCHLATAAVGPRARIAIIYNPEKDPELPYLGIHMQDIPRAYLAEADSMESGGDDLELDGKRIADRKTPPGWRDSGFTGKKRACLDHIKKVWTDRRLLNLRR